MTQTESLRITPAPESGQADGGKSLGRANYSDEYTASCVG
jgi:hypothetical protein